MDKIQKLLKRITKKDRTKLLIIIEQLIDGKTLGLNIKKITNTDFYRLRSGRFRVIFHQDGNNVIIDSIRLRNEKTYK